MNFAHFKFNNVINKRDNLALRANFVTSVDTFAFLEKEFDMKPLLFLKHMKYVLVFFFLAGGGGGEMKES